MATITAIAEQYGISDRQIRNYLGAIASAHPGQELKIDRQTLTEFAIEQIAEIRAIGPAAYGRRYAPVESQPEPIAPVQPQSQPQPQPQPVYEMATNPGYELTTQAQPAAIAFQVVEIDPGSQLATVPVVSSGPSNLVPFAPVSNLAQSNIQSAQNAIAAARSIAQGVRSRLEIGNDVSWQQQQIVSDELAALDLEIAELEIAGQLHRQQQIRTQAVQNLAGSEVGKRLARLQQLASANGYQLQPLSS